MALDFTAIDFETANGFRGSPCSVGLTKVRNGVIVDEGYWLMRPPEGHDHFDSRNITIHNITPDDVAASPRLPRFSPRCRPSSAHDALVAHNAAFDIGVIRSASEVSGMPAAAYDYACTVVLSRKNYSLPSYSCHLWPRRPACPANHHDATEDARACAGIMVDIAAKHGVDSVQGVFAAMKLPMPHIDAYNPVTDAMSKATRSALEKMAEMKAGMANGTLGRPLQLVHRGPQSGAKRPRGHVPPASLGRRLFSPVILGWAVPRPRSGPPAMVPNAPAASP